MNARFALTNYSYLNNSQSTSTNASFEYVVENRFRSNVSEKKLK